VKFFTRVLLSLEKAKGTRFSLIPQVASELTSMLKDSTLISVTGFIHDVLWRATRVGRAEFKNLDAPLIAAIIYLILITIISLGVKILKDRMTTAQSSTEVST